MADNGLDALKQLLSASVAQSSPKTFKQKMGIDPGSTGSTIANIIGTALMASGIVGSIAGVNDMKTFEKENKKITANVESMYADFANNLNSTQAGFENALSENTSKVSNDIKSDLLARGINDNKVADSSVNAYKASTSGAYAAARAALEAAKYSATSSMSKTKVGYYENLAELNFKSAYAKKAAQMGIWGVLGGSLAAGAEASGLLKSSGNKSSNSSSSNTPSETTESDQEEPTTTEYASPDQKAEQEAA